MTGKTKISPAPESTEMQPSCKILDVALLELNASRRLVRAGVDMPQKTSLSYDFKLTRHRDDASVIVLQVPTEVFARYEDGEEPALVIRAVWVAALQFDPALDLSAESITGEQMYFFKCLALNIIWPYWREFAKTITVSMSLLPIQLPFEAPLGNEVVDADPHGKPLSEKSKARSTKKRSAKK